MTLLKIAIAVIIALNISSCQAPLISIYSKQQIEQPKIKAIEVKIPDKNIENINNTEVSRGTNSRIFRSTAYCYTGNKTSTGTWPKAGRTIAADPKVLPYGTKLIINGVSGYVVEDCGGAIKGNKIDIYMNTYQECIKWGVRDIEVVVQEE